MVDDQIAYEALKLLYLMGQNLDEVNRDFLVKIISEGGCSLLKLLQAKGAEVPESALEKAIRELFTMLYKVE